MKTLKFLVVLVAVVTSACTGPISPSRGTISLPPGQISNPGIPFPGAGGVPIPEQKPIDAEDNWHRLIDANGNPIAMKVRIDWVKRAKGGLCGSAGCFQMHAVACMDEIPNPNNQNLMLASMMIHFYFSEDGQKPSSGGAGGGIVANGSCFDINQDGRAGNIMFQGTKYLIAWGTYGPLFQDFGQLGPTGRLGGLYMWDLGDY